MRALFSDGWNSIWHVIFGIFGSKYTVIIIGFLVYQLVKHTPISESFAGITEFFVGVMLSKALGIA